MWALHGTTESRTVPLRAAEYTYKELDRIGGDPTKLDIPLQTVAILYTIQAIIDNGGFRYLFESSFPINPPYSAFIAAYRRIGSNGAAERLEKAVAAFPFADPVFVLTHHARAPLEMKGGTTFYFVTDGPESALRQAKAAAGGKDVRVGGGVATIRQYLGAIDEMHLAVSPLLLGEGENLFAGVNFHQMGYKVEKSVAGERATHLILRK